MPFYRTSYTNKVKVFINFLLANPKTVILVPIMFSFIISYGVWYDLTIKRLNFQIQGYFDNNLNQVLTPSSSSSPHAWTSPQDVTSLVHNELTILSHSLSELDWENENFTLTKITISGADNLHEYPFSTSSNYNVLSYGFLDQLNKFQEQLLANHSNIIEIISPLSFWPVQFNKNESIMDSKVYKRQSDVLLRYINSKTSMHLDSFFLKDISRLNSLINHARKLSIYVLSKGEETISKSESGTSCSHFQLKLQSTTKIVSIKDFVSFINREAEKTISYYSILSNLLINSIIVIIIIGFFAYTTLCILNQYKIRSKFGLLLGWYIEVMISICASVSILSYWKGVPWTVLFEPSTLVTRFSFVFLISLISSNSMLNLITYLSGDNGFYEGENGLRIRLLKFYIGIDPLVNPQARIVDDGSISTSEIGSFPAGGVTITNGGVFEGLQDHISIQCSHACRIMNKGFGLMKRVFLVPLTAKCLFMNLFVFTLLKSASTSVVKSYYTGEIGVYFSSRISNFISAVMIAIIIDQILQLTYLVCIVVMDLKRFELTDLLKIVTTTSGSGANGTAIPEGTSIFAHTEELFGVNIFSKVLLRLCKPPQLRPSRSSFRHKFGQFLLNIKNPAPSCLRLGFNTLITIGFLIATFVSWTVSIPHEILNDEIQFYEEITVVHQSYDILYYMELISIVLFIIGVAGVTFRYTYSEIAKEMKKSASNLSQSTSIDSLFEFDYESKKFFNYIDLIGYGHTLDVLKIKTNSASPFIVTIGLDHKILIWSPLYKPEIPRPINIGSINATNGKEFWPINHINISNDGNYTILINYKNGLVKCYERKQLKYSWEIQLPEEIVNSNFGKLKILESFFRRRTVPGYLTRKIHQQKKAARRSDSRRNSVSSSASFSSNTSSLNGNYQAPSIITDMYKGINEASETNNGHSESYKNQSNGNGPSNDIDSALSPKDDFIVILESGIIVSIACGDGSIKTCNIFQSTYLSDAGNSLKVTSSKKMSTPRICDRIICHLNNFDIIVVSLMNNNFIVKKLNIQHGFYNMARKLVAPLMTKSISESNDFKSVYNTRGTTGGNGDSSYKFNPSTIDMSSEFGSDFASSSSFQFNQSLIVPVEFVGMVIRVKNLSAELIDIQSGMLLRTFSIGHFKPNSFRVSHSEPTHCKFCGCASIQSFSLIYQEHDSNTLIMHTFRIDAKKSKNNICLRVERDPREIRCLGFNAVAEHQYWFDNVEKWELTDINVIIGLKRRNKINEVASVTKLQSNDCEMERCDSSASTSIDRHFSSLVQGSGLTSLRSRTKGELSKPISSSSSEQKLTFDDLWEGFIITANDGKLMNYRIPSDNSSPSVSVSSPLCIEKFGYKSVAISFENLIKVIYLGSDKLIEKDLYYSGTNTGLGSVFPNSDVNVTGVNNGLLFINKRRMHREKGVRR
ncbi:hypothetical protein CLIB1423_06S05006 [[Candida] railenensis]|uniref:Sterol regulatory element-binding protein cleavage-activating protein n=1 Tax=[Candida] railenensis TaxID=45579 RepID=A0A9P0VXV1_9ASCO|nr:hypothetical protein CLIB1423_06S05006 [[Candida] railenensis]